MLQDVIRPPESHSSADLPELPVPLFDFTAEEILFVDTLSNPPPPPEVSTSNCSEDTRFSSSSPSVEDSHRNPCPPAVLKPDVVFPANFAPALPFNDQFDLSTLSPFPSSSSSYGEASALGYELPPPPAIGLNGTPPVPCVLAPPFDAEMQCLSPFPNFLGFCKVLPNGLAPAVSVEQERAFHAMGSMQVIPAPELELNGETGAGVFAADPVHRVYSATDIQVLQENQLVGSGCGGNLTSDAPALDETRFKVGRYSLEERKQRIHRYMKKRNERNFNKKIKYACRKTLADSRPRVRGRFAKNEEFSDTTASSRSHHYDEVDISEDKEQELIDSSDIFAHISGVNSLNSNYPIQSWT